MELGASRGVLAQDIALLHIGRGLPAGYPVREAGSLELRDRLGLGRSDDVRHRDEVGPRSGASMGDDHPGGGRERHDEDGHDDPGPRAARAARQVLGFDDGRLLIRRGTVADGESAGRLRRAGAQDTGGFFLERVGGHLRLALLRPMRMA